MKKQTQSPVLKTNHILMKPKFSQGLVWRFLAFCLESALEKHNIRFAIPHVLVVFSQASSAQVPCRRRLSSSGDLKSRSNYIKEPGDTLPHCLGGRCSKRHPKRGGTLSTDTPLRQATGARGVQDGVAGDPGGWWPYVLVSSWGCHQMWFAVNCLASRSAACHACFIVGGTKDSELSFSQHSTSTASFLWQDIQSWAGSASKHWDRLACAGFSPFLPSCIGS